MTVTTAATNLDALDERYWQATLRRRPLFATAIGDRRFDHELEDWRPAAVAAERARLEATLVEARSIDPASLEPADRITHSVLLETVNADLAVIDSGVHEWIVDPLEGPQVLFNDIESFQLIRTPGEAEAMVERWRAMGPSVDALVERLRKSLADGRVAAVDPVDRVVDELDELLGRSTKTWALMNPARREHPDWPLGATDRFRGDLASAVEDSVVPAFRRLRSVLADEIRPAARPSDRPGIMHVPGGDEAYRRLIRHHTSLDVSPEELHRTGLREIERIDAEFVELGGRVLGASGLDDALGRLRADAALYFSIRDEIFAKAESALARAREAIADWFGILPQAPCEVVAMAAHEEKHSSIAYYREPATDGSRPGQYFVNTYAPETRPRYEAEALAYHEAIPGHHLQIAIGQELAGLPAFRRHLGPTAFFEGWGLYTERLSDEMGLYSADLDLFGILSFDAWRACRLVLDTGMHALGWTRDQAIDYMVAHTALGRNNIANEVDRYIVWPGQALAYKAGQLEIQRLRGEAYAALGDRFEIRAFHDAVLGNGAVPLATLRELIAGYVESAGA
jgi:uncharacterized protein (DUF885 family)